MGLADFWGYQAHHRISPEDRCNPSGVRMRPASPTEQADRRYDLRKGDAGEPLEITAGQIVGLIRAQNWKNGGVHSLDWQEAIDLIESYAKIVAGEAVLVALEESHKRAMAIFDEPVSA